MSMQLINLLNIPAKYRDRYSKVKNVLMSDFNIEINDVYKIFKAKTGTRSSNYLTQIAFKLDGSKITPNSEIKVDCQCKSFQFEFAEVIARNKGLLVDHVGTYKVTNKYMILTGCKHLIFLGRYIFDRKSIFGK